MFPALFLSFPSLVQHVPYPSLAGTLSPNDLFSSRYVIGQLRSAASNPVRLSGLNKAYQGRVPR